MTSQKGESKQAENRDLASLVFDEARPEHFEALSVFLKENDTPSITNTFNPFPMNSQTAYCIACEPHRDRYYMALMSDHLVGLSMLRGWDEGYDVPSFGIVVDHRFHNLGIGARLTEFTIAEAKRLGCNSLRLSVFASNPGAIHIYSACGFVETERREITVAGERDEKIIMVKTF